MIDLECPRCFGVVPAENTSTDQYSQCEDCGTAYKITYDLNWHGQGQHYLKPLDPPTEMDLRAATRGI